MLVLDVGQQQFGVDQLDLRVFDQDKWWVDHLGRPHRLEEMSAGYRRAVCHYLRRLAPSLHAAMALREVLEACDAADGSISWVDIASELGLPTIGSHDPWQWLESTPLFRRLTRLLTDDDDHR